MSLRFGLRLSPICRAMVQAKQPMMMLRVLALSRLAVMPPRPGTDQHAGAQAPYHSPVHRPGLLVRTQELKPVKIMVGSEVPRARWVMISGATPCA